MRTRSRLALVTLSMIAGLSLTAVSCAPESTSAPTNVDLLTAARANASSLREQYNWMGKYHNDGLAFALGRIKSSKRVAKLDRCRVGLAALKDFQKAFRKSGGGSAVFDDLTITDGMCEAAAFPTVSQSTRLLAPDGVVRSNISFAANNYMNQIESQADIAPSVLSLSFAVAKIQNQAEANLGSLEASAVGGTGSIAVSSAEYWNANEGAWSDPSQVPYARSAEFFPGPRVNQLSARGRRILRADIAAAIGVLVYDWWMGEAALGKAAIKAAAASLIAGIYTT